jgi:5-methylcytosine-specific restriction protein A
MRFEARARPASNRRGYDRRWRRYTAAYLKRHPICACGCGCRSEVVDHIVPVSRGGSFWDPKNHQAMAKLCHDRKTAREDGGFGNQVRMTIV